MCNRLSYAGRAQGSVLLFLVCLVLSGAAQAAPRSERVGRFGLEVGFGAAGCTGACDDENAPLVGFWLHGLHRVHPYVGTGWHFAMPFFDFREQDAVSFGVLLGGEVRFYLPIGRHFELWGGLALGYAHHQHEWGGDRHHRLARYGLGVGYGIGGHYFVTRRIAVGGAVWIYTPFLLSWCLDEWNEARSCESSSEDGSLDYFVQYWMVGASVVFHLGGPASQR